MRGLCYRIVLTLINICFPPLSVAMLAGFEWDCMLNCILFLCGVLPSHVHGFYIGCVYFHRRRKVKKGRWPGGPKHLIHSSNVLNGGASPRQAELLYQKEFGMLGEKRFGSKRYRNGGGSRSGRQHHGSQQGRSSLRPPSVYSMDRGRR